MFRSRPSRLASRAHARVDDVASGAHESRALLTLDSIGDAVLSTDLAGKVTYLNAVAERLTGWSACAAVGRPLQEVMKIVDADSREPVRDPLALAVRCEANVGVGVNCLLIARDGRETPIEDTAAPIRDRKSRVIGAVIVFHDVGAAHVLSLRMSHLAQHDVLTGLPNRLLLTDRLDRAVASARRLGNLLAVLFIDLDRFKSINDSLGHAAGDQVLQSVASRLVAGVRRSDTVSRLGGDEFVVLLTEVTSARNAKLAADKLCAAIAAPYAVEGSDLCVTASAGVGVYPADGADAEALLKSADLELLQVKARRRAMRAMAGSDRPGSSPSTRGASFRQDPTARRADPGSG
jgi:diguanylate cyclase (GGDEF)-like protein/PAS domain S-box-containing protein